jgi:hypothetical protein
MAEFTQENRQALKALFALEDHEIREGVATKGKAKIQWFVYLRREAIQERLDDLFFGEWELYFVDPKQPCIYHKEHVDSTMGLAIRGIRREYNGSQDGGGLNGAKGAATDAIKRVASLWGIGLYMQNAPQIWTENYVTYDASGKKLTTDWKKKDRIQADVMRQIGIWLKNLGASGNSLYFEPSIQEEPANNGESFLPPNVTSASFTPQDPAKNEKATGTILTVDVRVNDKTQSRHIVAGGVTFFGRDVFRALSYDQDIIDRLDKKGAVNLSDGIQIVYRVDDDNFKHAVRVKRLGTGEVISMADLKEKKAANS